MKQLLIILWTVTAFALCSNNAQGDNKNPETQSANCHEIRHTVKKPGWTFKQKDIRISNNCSTTVKVKSLKHYYANPKAEVCLEKYQNGSLDGNVIYLKLGEEATLTEGTYRFTLCNGLYRRGGYSKATLISMEYRK